MADSAEVLALRWRLTVTGWRYPEDLYWVLGPAAQGEWAMVKAGLLVIVDFTDEARARGAAERAESYGWHVALSQVPRAQEAGCWVVKVQSSVRMAEIVLGRECSGWGQNGGPSFVAFRFDAEAAATEAAAIATLAGLPAAATRSGPEDWQW